MAYALSDYKGDCPPHVISKLLRRAMRARGKMLRLPAEFGRPYKCVVDSLRSYYLDDWLHFLETFSAFILQDDILDSVMQEMWQKLR